MKFLSKNTLAYYNAAPQTHRHNLSELPVSVLAASSLKYKTGCDHASPNEDAVTFYTLNHAAGIVRNLFTANEPLPSWAQIIMESYTDVCMKQGERMLHYILCITTREMRHLKSCSAAFWAKLETTFDPASVALLKHISSDGGEETAMNKFLKTPPDMTIGQYVKTLAFGFHKAGSAGWAGSYGGKPWGDVTDALSAMIHGETSMEMLVDTGYTLAHNGGPIFNKGMMYSMYDQHFMTILDAQRAGQMLDLMLLPDAQTLHVKKTDAAVQVALLIQAHKPNEVKGFVDWKLVDELRPAGEKSGSPSKYSKMIGVQKKPSSVKPKVVAPKAEPAFLKGKKIKVTGTWQVYPHQTVEVYERVNQ